MYSVGYLEEPWDLWLLRTLEVGLPKLKQTPDLLQATTILYRYNRPQGKVILQKAAENKSAYAAAVLALNQETTALPAIRQAILSSGKVSEDLMRAVSQWKNPALNAATLEAYRKNKSSPYLTMAIAAKTLQSSEKEIWKAHNCLSNEGIQKLSISQWRW